MTDLEALVVAAYVFADEYPVPARAGRPALIERRGTGRARGLSSGDRDQLRPAVPRPGRAGAAGLVSALAGAVAVQPPPAGLVGLISIVQQQLARWLDLGGVRLSRRQPARCRQLSRLPAEASFAGFARYGYAKSQHRFVWGVRLVLLTDERGPPLGYTIVPANEKEYEPLADLLSGIPASRDRRQRPLGPRLPRTARRRRHDAAHARQDSAPPPTQAANARSPQPGW